MISCHQAEAYDAIFYPFLNDFSKLLNNLNNGAYLTELGLLCPYTPSTSHLQFNCLPYFYLPHIADRYLRADSVSVASMAPTGSICLVYLCYNNPNSNNIIP